MSAIADDQVADAAPETQSAGVDPGRTGRRFAVLLALFFGTGACGLVYQQLWLRELSLVFGVTVQAVSTVLAAFFGGLALGGYLAGRWSRRTSRPIAWYGILEIGVGVLAVLTPFALDLAGDGYVWIAKNVTGSLAALTVVRFVLSFLVLMVPATLMGASLPLVMSSTTVRGGAIGGRVGMLYSLNTAGAVVGTVVSGFWLIGRWGLQTTFYAAAAINIAVGSVAVLAARRWDTSNESTSHVVEARPATDPATPVVRRVVLAVFALSGFVTLALELVWFRELVLFLESSTYAFTVMLATVLVGIAVGSAVAAPILRRRRATAGSLALIEVLLGLASLISFFMLSKSFGVVNRASDLIGGGEIRFVIVASALAMLPATLLMGFAFPFGIELWVGDDRDDTGGRVGTFYAVNVASGIAGSVVAGFWLVPAVGTRTTLMLLALTTIAIGIVLAWLALPPRSALAFAGVAVAVTAITATTFVPDPYDSVIYHRFPGQQLEWKADDAQTTVSIHTLDGYRIMYVDGQHQASTEPSMVGFHGLLGALPTAIHPDPLRALVIGLGGGVSPGALSQAPGIEVDVVELSEEVVTGATYLEDFNNNITELDNVSIRVDDGRNYMLTTDERYDIITADVIPPSHAGAGKLWSVEYWELTRDTLAPGGIMAQWVPQDDADAYGLIVRSFTSVFPHTTAWAGGSILIGSNEPLQIDRDAVEARITDPAWGAVMARIGVSNWESYAGWFTAGPQSIERLVGEGPLLTDDRPRLEYFRTGSSGSAVIGTTTLDPTPIDDFVNP